jgi:hypothetical protein
VRRLGQVAAGGSVDLVVGLRPRCCLKVDLSCVAGSREDG